MSETIQPDLRERFVSQADIGKLAASAFLYERDADEAALPFSVTREREADGRALKSAMSRIEALGLTPATENATAISIVEMSVREAAVLDKARHLDPRLQGLFNS
ncbi:MAG TPA: hypothetical protein VK978_02755 [Candidatus Saccharimonadales bacterium]|nr:hypothetical protein [Candidatus Saccharimonadales bacterium]